MFVSSTKTCLIEDSTNYSLICPTLSDWCIPYLISTSGTSNYLSSCYQVFTIFQLIHSKHTKQATIGQPAKRYSHSLSLVDWLCPETVYLLGTSKYHSGNESFDFREKVLPRKLFCGSAESSNEWLFILSKWKSWLRISVLLMAKGIFGRRCWKEKKQRNSDIRRDVIR